DVLRESRRFGSALAARFQLGSRLMMVFENGPEFLYAFFGSILAGMVPLPMSPPLLVRRRRDYVERLERIAAEAEVALVAVEDRFADALPSHLSASTWSALSSETSGTLADTPRTR